MKNNIKKLLLITSLLIPSIVYAESITDPDFPLGFALGMEAFVSIHMSVFVLSPLSKMFAKENSKKLFWTLFAIRAGILLFFDFFVTPQIAVLDFFAVFVGAFILVPISFVITNGKNLASGNLGLFNSNVPVFNQTNTNEVSGIELKCAKCGTVIELTDKFCPNCGSAIDKNNVVVAANANASVQVPPKITVKPSNFDSMYSLTEDNMVEAFIKKEMTKAGMDPSSKLIPRDILKRKTILNLIFIILLFIYISIIFIHYPLYTYVIGLVILFVFFKSTRKYDLLKYLKKQVKARPGERVTNIVMNAKNTSVQDTSKPLFIFGILAALVLPLVIFSSPRIIYEKVDNGYAVRYYAFGLTNYKTATIPDTYKGEPIVGLRGNTFSNMPFLEKVTLPDTIKEIRGQAFLNCKKLTEVNMPTELEYLGGGAFYNASSLKSISFSDKLTYMGGEAFYGASSLTSVRLSENLSEIRGDSFEYCTSLKNIKIPDSITRIGGHAFYGDTSLKNVIISEKSELEEIGSSAFRQCTNLTSIQIPKYTLVNERAFKESPTVVIRYTYDKYVMKEYNDIS